MLLAKDGYKFDLAFTSVLKRAIKTLWHSLEQTDTMYIPVKHAWQLNERYEPLVIVLSISLIADRFATGTTARFRDSTSKPL